MDEAIALIEQLRQECADTMPVPSAITFAALDALDEALRVLRRGKVDRCPSSITDEWAGITIRCELAPHEPGTSHRNDDEGFVWSDAEGSR